MVPATPLLIVRLFKGGSDEFRHPRGTRGGRQPGGKLIAWVNTWTLNRIRSNADKVMGMRALVLTTVGAKTGARRHHRSPPFSSMNAANAASSSADPVDRSRTAAIAAAAPSQSSAMASARSAVKFDLLLVQPRQRPRGGHADLGQGVEDVHGRIGLGSLTGSSRLRRWRPARCAGHRIRSAAGW